MKELNLDYLKKFPDQDSETIKKSQIETTTLDNEFASNNFPHFNGKLIQRVLNLRY